MEAKLGQWVDESITSSGLRASSGSGSLPVEAQDGTLSVTYGATGAGKNLSTVFIVMLCPCLSRTSLFLSFLLDGITQFSNQILVYFCT